MAHGKGGLGNAGIAGLAGLIGKLAYERQLKHFKGVPLTPLTTMDELGRYNVAAEVARQKGEAMPSSSRLRSKSKRITSITRWWF